MAYWRWDNYVRDLDEGAGFNFNSNQSRLHSAIGLGERLWLISGKREKMGVKYVLVACLQIAAKTYNSPDYKYGRYRVWADIRHSAYYSADGPDLGNLFLNLEFQPKKPVQRKEQIGQSLQTMRNLSEQDVTLLVAWAKGLKLESRAYQIADEVMLEKSYENGENFVKETVAEYHSGVSSQRKLLLQHSYPRNRALVGQLHKLYNGRCQLCGFDPELLYGVRASSSHHIIYLSRGGNDAIENLLLVCPNHHEIIHATKAVFDFKSLCYIFPNTRTEPLVLNHHLNALQ